MDDNYLQHFGVLGMRWGVRKSRSPSSSSYKKKKNKTKGWSKDAKEAYRIKRKRVNQMTNKELQSVNKRRELETKYNQLNPSKVKKGLAVAGGIAAGLGTIASLYNNSSNIIKIGKKITNKFI